MKPTLPSLFDQEAQHDAMLQKMREDAMKAEYRRYFREEAKLLFKAQLRDAAERAGHDFDKLLSEDENSGSKIPQALSSAPRVVAHLFLVLLLLFVGVTFLYGMLTGHR